MVVLAVVQVVQHLSPLVNFYENVKGAMAWIKDKRGISHPPAVSVAGLHVLTSWSVRLSFSNIYIYIYI